MERSNASGADFGPHSQITLDTPTSFRSPAGAGATITPAWERLLHLHPGPIEAEDLHMTNAWVRTVAVCLLGWVALATAGCVPKETLAVKSLECEWPQTLGVITVRGKVTNASKRSLSGFRAIMTFRSDDRREIDKRRVTLWLKPGGTATFEADTSPRSDITACGIRFEDRHGQRMEHTGPSSVRRSS